MASADDQSVKLGVDATTVAAGRAAAPRASESFPNTRAYALASADLFFTAKLAQYTSFFADVVALSGAPPDREIPSLTLLNGYTARLVNQNELNLREAWLRTRVLRSASGADRRPARPDQLLRPQRRANDETTQFISDALVNNQMLGLAVERHRRRRRVRSEERLQLPLRRPAEQPRRDEPVTTRSTRWPRSATRRRRSRCRKGTIASGSVRTTARWTRRGRSASASTRRSRRS